ncbi:type II secretion system protein [Marinobacter sp. M216]|uniref:Type II secretion system protein n=1 Tax=Marinobacter albus TaxID=3030833 RepID=A0ABT7HGV7_9GAMM|nr:MULTISPECIES: type II secretion system protein [unclassified Marinobacter]MBW7473002.1 type II secretion system GspH family protein [Marinobacter sp. F4218]MDK9559605.1 type II secretion system protein [Marinobacter sp. M216]
MGSNRGFTLVELVMVIVLLAIVATISVRFVALSTQGAVDVSSRQLRSFSAVIISEHLSRALREALPGSIRANGDGSCIEWMPVVAVSNYLNLPGNANPDSFEAVPLAGGASASGRVVVYGYGSNLYTTGNPGPISPEATLPSGASPVTVAFNGGANHRFTAKSPERKFFVIEEPRTFCQQSSFLFRYRGYGIQSAVASALPATMPGREVVAGNLVPGSLNFEVVPPTLQRSGVVSFRFQVRSQQTGEMTNVSQEVQVRNVP